MQQESFSESFKNTNAYQIRIRLKKIKVSQQLIANFTVVIV